MAHTDALQRPCEMCHNAIKRAGYVTGDGDRISHAQVFREKYGLTPHRCNLVTWAVEENPDLLYAVRAYLDRHRKRSQT